LLQKFTIGKVIKYRSLEVWQLRGLEGFKAVVKDLLSLCGGLRRGNLSIIYIFQASKPPSCYFNLYTQPEFQTLGLNKYIPQVEILILPREVKDILLPAKLIPSKQLSCQTSKLPMPY